MILVTDARTLPDYRLWVRFSDAKEGEMDLKDFIAAAGASKPGVAPG